MKPRTVVVVHREAMVAEGIAAGLARFPDIVPVAAANSLEKAERRAGLADAVALDSLLPGVDTIARRLMRKGVRVVYIGDRNGEDVGMSVSQRASIAELAAALVPQLVPRPPSPHPLTPREREVLALVGRGLAAKQVARHLGISSKTVERHKTRIFAKLRVPNQVAAVRMAMTGGWEGRDPWVRSRI